MRYYLKIKNEQESELIQKILFAFGYKWISVGAKTNFINTNWMSFGLDGDKYLAYAIGGNEFYESRPDEYKLVTLSEAVELIQNYENKAEYIEEFRLVYKLDGEGFSSDKFFDSYEDAEKEGKELNPIWFKIEKQFRRV